jgi:hypothetical protein
MSNFTHSPTTNVHIHHHDLDFTTLANVSNMYKSSLYIIINFEPTSYFRTSFVFLSTYFKALIYFLSPE